MSDNEIPPFLFVASDAESHFGTFYRQHGEIKLFVQFRKMFRVCCEDAKFMLGRRSKLLRIFFASGTNASRFTRTCAFRVHFLTFLYHGQHKLQLHTQVTK